MNHDPSTVVSMPIERRPRKGTTPSGAPAQVHVLPSRRDRLALPARTTVQPAFDLDQSAVVRDVGARLIVEVATLPACDGVDQATQRARMFALVGQLLTAYERTDKRARDK